MPILIALIITTAFSLGLSQCQFDDKQPTITSVEWAVDQVNRSEGYEVDGYEICSNQEFRQEYNLTAQDCADYQ